MILKIALLIAVGLSLFSLGFFLGGINWEMAEPEKSTSVAFWAMLGGWLSGIATLLAVILSLYLAYASSLTLIEKLHISLSEFKINTPEPNSYRIVLNIKSERNVRTQVINVGIQFDKMTSPLYISNLKAGGSPIPFSLERMGEVTEFWLYLNSSIRLTTIFKQLEKPIFSKGSFIVDTTMKRYELKMTHDVLNAFKLRYEMLES